MLLSVVQAREFHYLWRWAEAHPKTRLTGSVSIGWALARQTFPSSRGLLYGLEIDAEEDLDLRLTVILSLIHI